MIECIILKLLLYNNSKTFFEKTLLFSEVSKSWTFEHSLHIMNIVFNTFLAYVFDVFIISLTCMHIHHYLSSYNKICNHNWNIDIQLPEYFKSMQLPEYFKSIQLLEYFKSMQLPEYFKSIQLPEYFKSIQLLEYFTSIQLLQYFKSMQLLLQGFILSAVIYYFNLLL